MLKTCIHKHVHMRNHAAYNARIKCRENPYKTSMTGCDALFRLLSEIHADRFPAPRTYSFNYQHQNYLDQSGEKQMQLWSQNYRRAGARWRLDETYQTVYQLDPHYGRDVDLSAYETTEQQLLLAGPLKPWGYRRASRRFR